MSAETKDLPVMLVCYDPRSETLAWKAKGVKGAKWHSGCKDIDQVVREWDKAGLPARCVMEYTDQK